MRLKKFGDGLGLTVNVSVEGSTCGFYVKASDLKAYNESLKGTEYYNEFFGNDTGYQKHSDDEDLTDDEIELRLLNGVKSTKTKMIKAYSKLKKKPNFFITLSFKTERFTTEILSNDERWRCMHNFARNIHYEFPNSWFFPIVGYTKGQGLHFHIPSYIDYEDYCDFDYLKNFCLVKWQLQLFKCDSRDCFDIRKFEKKKFSYLTKKGKNHEFKAVRKIDKNCRLYTRLYKNNMIFYEVKRYQLSVEELEELQVEIEKYHMLHGIEPYSVSHQFEYWSGRVSFVPYKLLIKTIERIIKKREDFIKYTLLPDMEE